MHSSTLGSSQSHSFWVTLYIYTKGYTIDLKLYKMCDSLFKKAVSCSALACPHTNMDINKLPGLYDDIYYFLRCNQQVHKPVF